MNFQEWLIDEKKYSNKGSGDVISRMKRIKRILGKDEMDENSLMELQGTSEFATLSMNVKSQLRRAIRLFLEFKSNDKQ